MNKRERYLAIGVGVLVAGLVLTYLNKSISGMFRDRQTQIDNLVASLETEHNAHRGKLAAHNLRAYKEKSLASKDEVAQTQYKMWLFELADEVKFNNPTVTAGVIHDRGDRTYRQHSFRITTDGDLKQVTQFLHKFYEQDYLHRIKGLTLKSSPRKPGQMQIMVDIDVVSLKGAEENKTLEDRASTDRLTHGAVEDYERVILGRNLFGPPNQPPKFTYVSSSPLDLGKDESIRIRTDPGEPNQLVKLKILNFKVPGTDPVIGQDGSIQVRSDKEGEGEVTLEAEDNGFPPKKVTQVVKFEFRKPRGAAPPPPSESPFDNSSVAFYTAYVEVNDQPEAWVSIRISDTMLRLHEGEEVSVGTFQGTVKQITREMFVVENDKSTMVVRSGRSLSEAERTEKPQPKQPTKPVSTEEPAKDEPAQEAPAKEEPAKEAPAEEAPAKEEPAKEAPAKEEPAKEDASKEAPAKEEPAKEEPAKEEPAKEDAGKEEPKAAGAAETNGEKR